MAKGRTKGDCSSVISSIWRKASIAFDCGGLSDYQRGSSIHRSPLTLAEQLRDGESWVIDGVRYLDSEAIRFVDCKPD